MHDAAMPGTVRLTVDRGHAELTLDRPEVRNAMNPQMLADLAAATTTLATLDDLRSLVVTGAGEDFSCGGDLSALGAVIADPATDTYDDTRRRLGDLHAAIVALCTLPCPTVAAVDGLAAGSGFSLALACDVRVATPRAVFTPAYARAGLSPDAGMSWLLPRVVGEAAARAILLEDLVVRAERATALWLVDRVVEPAELLGAARRRARRIARPQGDYVRVVKELLASARTEMLDVQLDHERDRFCAAAASDRVAATLAELADASTPA